MTDALSELVKLFPPPCEPVAAPPWEQSRAEIGLDFPSDYRAFVDRYGAGEFGVAGSGSFYVRAPSSCPCPDLREVGFKGYVESHALEMAELFDFEGADEDYWGGIVYPMHPRPEGLLTWGDNENGDTFWWLTEGDDPDKWPVIMWARGLATTFRFEMGLVEVLLRIAHGEIPSVQAMRSPQRRWTMTSDWLRDRLSISAGPAAPS
jgi:hypothetical protein